MECTLGWILSGFRNGAAEKTKESQKWTTEAMGRIIEKPDSRKSIFDLHSVTICDITGAITEVIVESGCLCENELYTACCMPESADEPERRTLSVQSMGMVSSTTAPSSLRMDMHIAPLL